MTTDERLGRMEQILGELVETSRRNEERWTSNEKRWDEQESVNRDTLTRIDAYQKASTQVVNLAFALIGAATVALVGIVLRLAVNL